MSNQFGLFIGKQITFLLLYPAVNTHTAHTSIDKFGYQQQKPAIFPIYSIASPNKESSNPS
jgi:hypothetical protein